MHKVQREKQSVSLNQDASSSESAGTHNRYKLKCSLLGWDEANKTLTLRDPRGNKWDYDFHTFFFPLTIGSPVSLPVAALDDLYINTLLFQIDKSVAIVGEKSKDRTKAVSVPIRTFMYVLTYLRNRGIYTLKAAREDDMMNLARELGEKNWHLILNREHLWHQTLADVESIDIPIHVLFRVSKTGHIDSLNKSFWEEKIGYGACDNYSYETKQRIFQYCEDRGYLYKRLFKQWLAEETNESFYSQAALKNIFSDINRLAIRQEGVDCLEKTPFFNISDLSRKYCKRPDGRTENISLSDGTYLLKRSLEIVFDHGPNFLEILKKINQQQFFITSSNKDPQKCKSLRFKDFSSHQVKQFLKNEKPFDDLTNTMGLPAIRNWSPSSKLSDKTTITLLHLIAIVQGACAIVIIFLNGRRNGEVLDKYTGLRTTDLFQFNDELGIYRCNFYIEKTYQDRHPFYVNRSTASAILLLTGMKELMSEVTGRTDDEHLFSLCTPVPINISRNLKNRSFDFSGLHTLSIGPLMSYLYPDGNAPNLKPHMGRRFFGLLYQYRYDNATLLSLRQQFRHFDIIMTKVYITDPDFRDDAKNIASTIGKRKDVTLVEKKLYESLELEIRDLKDEVEAAGRERFTDIITRIISGEASAGGFPRFIRKLYKRFAKDIEFSESSSSEQGKIISKRLQAQGYKPNSMPHGQCNAPKPRGALNAKCRDEKNQTNIELACADLCEDCQYHYNNEGFLQNLKDDAKQLKMDMDNFMLPPMQQKKSKDDYENLIKIIELNKKTMEKNLQLMMKTIQELYE